MRFKYRKMRSKFEKCVRSSNLVFEFRKMRSESETMRGNAKVTF